MPQHLRSGTAANDADLMVESTSIAFTRAVNARSGVLSFNLKDQHNCRVEYWADDPSGTPPPASPLTIDCAKEGLNLTQKVTVAGLTPGFPLSFRIFVWPKTTTFLAHFVINFHEGQDLTSAKAQNLVVVRYAAPRHSAEIYTYRLPASASIADIKTKISSLSPSACVANPPAQALPYPRNTSLEDDQKRPLLGLSTVTTEGYGSAAAAVHPFYPTRLVEFYPAIQKQENWKWNFQWDAQPFSFESLPPGAIGSLSISDGKASQDVTNRTLSGALDTIQLTANTLKISPKVINPADISHFELTIKSADAAETLLTCRFALDKDTLEVPADFLSKLAQGNYLATFSFETNQIHYKDGAAYPPWIITAQDWVQFRLNKRL